MFKHLGIGIPKLLTGSIILGIAIGLIQYLITFIVLFIYGKYFRFIRLFRKLENLVQDKNVQM